MEQQAIILRQLRSVRGQRVHWRKWSNLSTCFQSNIASFGKLFASFGKVVQSASAFLGPVGLALASASMRSQWSCSVLIKQLLSFKIAKLVSVPRPTAKKRCAFPWFRIERAGCFPGTVRQFWLSGHLPLKTSGVSGDPIVCRACGQIRPPRIVALVLQEAVANLLTI